ncbi:MAG TPA: hypothetical protein VGD31_12060, partial [Sphingobacteriaceae bacterium]
MSLTRSRQPYQWQAVYNPIIYEFESSYINRWIDYGALKTVSSITNENGFNKVTTTGAHGYEAGDYVEVIDDDGNTFDFTGVQLITSVTSTTFITDRAYSSGISADTSVSKYAKNYAACLQVRAIIDGTDTLIATIKQQPEMELVSGTNYRPVFLFDVSKVLQTYINKQGYDVHSLTVEGLERNENSFLKYYVKFAEAFIEGVSGEPEFTIQSYSTDQNAGYGTNYRFALNAAIQYDEQIGTDDKLEQYLVTGTQQAKWLTDRPSCAHYLKPGDGALAYLITETYETSEDWVFKVWTEDENGNEVDLKRDNDHSARTEGSYSWLVNFDNLDYTGAKYIKAQLFEEITRDSASPYTITSLTNSGGFCRYVVDSPIDLYVGRKIDVEI